MVEPFAEAIIRQDRYEDYRNSGGSWVRLQLLQPREPESADAMSRYLHRVVMAFEIPPHECRDVRLIFDDQNAAATRRHSVRVLRTIRPSSRSHTHRITVKLHQ